MNKCKLKLGNKNGTVTLLGTTVDNNFKTDEDLSNICMKANSKLTALKG